MASYGGELLLDSSSPWSGIFSLFSFSIPLPFIFQGAKESIDEEDPRPTSSNGAYITGAIAIGRGPTEVTREATPRTSPAMTPLVEVSEEKDGAADTNYAADMVEANSTWDPWPATAQETS